MDVLIVGASVRAAAFSARRAGLIAGAIDLFADRDLKEIATVRRVRPARYPLDVERIADEFPPGPWMYTGALENHPSLIDRIGGSRPLWGNDGATVRAVRDPIRVAEALHRAGLPCPAVRSRPAGLPRDGSWLIKPLGSAGGRSIVPLSAATDRLREPCCYQARIEGQSVSAVARRNAGRFELLGITAQSIGRPDNRFAYTGSIGPLRVRTAVRQVVDRICGSLAVEFGLVGLFGVDFVLRDDVPWPVEVNPRYTASVEILELAVRRAFIRRPESRGSDDEYSVGDRAGSGPILGKAILFADRPCAYPDRALSLPAAFDLPWIADIPDTGTRFSAGDPVLTLFASSTTVADCKRRLAARLRRWGDWLRLSGSLDKPGGDA
jgi:predicted ATP-grasp superfamily ATP-dependent carboligase